MHLINAYLPREDISLGSVRTPDKSNEIKGIPILLKTLHIACSIITMDAMETQKGIVNLIREKQAHYVLALKNNHKKFYRKVDSIFTKTDKLNYQNMVYDQANTNDYGHQRIEDREYTILPMMYLFKYKKTWRDLSAIIRVRSVRDFLDKTKEKETSTRYYITSLPFKKREKMIEAIRTHWSIENKLHYKLDVGLHEDDCQIYRGHADQNLAAIRKLVLTLFEKEKSLKSGIALKRYEATLSTRYLRKVLNL